MAEALLLDDAAGAGAAGGSPNSTLILSWFRYSFAAGERSLSFGT